MAGRGDAPGEQEGSGGMSTTMRMVRPDSKRARIRRHVLELLAEHEATGSLPTTIRFLFYELEHRGLAQKTTKERHGRRRNIGWPPGSQDITDVITRLRDAGEIPWTWIADTERSVAVWSHDRTVAEYLATKLEGARLNPWEPGLPPLILSESKGVAEVLQAVAYEYVCPIAGLKGQTAGFLRTAIAQLLGDNDRTVLYLGDLDRCGLDIEHNAAAVLQAATGRLRNWTRIGLNMDQVEGVEPIWKTDGRDGQGHDAWELESLGQSALVALVRSTLDDLMPQPLTDVQEREVAEIESMRERLGAT
jgi:hypothetical protein